MIEAVAQSDLNDVVDVLVNVIEAAGAAVVFTGALLAFIRFVVVGLRTRDAAIFAAVRLQLGRFLALGLEFQLAGDILRTAISPTFEELGQLAAVATIRTVLNIFLRREIAEERAQVEADKRERSG